MEKRSSRISFANGDTRMKCVSCGYPIHEPLNEYGKRGFCGRVCYILLEGWKGNPLKSSLSTEALK